MKAGGTDSAGGRKASREKAAAARAMERPAGVNAAKAGVRKSSRGAAGVSKKDGNGDADRQAKRASKNAPGKAIGKAAGGFSASAPTKRERFKLKLYVAGQSPRSMTAFANLRRICEEHLQGQYEIEVIDLLVNPKLARGDQILAIPTLVRALPTPISKIIGDLSNTERVLVGLNIRPRG